MKRTCLDAVLSLMSHDPSFSICKVGKALYYRVSLFVSLSFDGEDIQSDWREQERTCKRRNGKSTTSENLGHGQVEIPARNSSIQTQLIYPCKSLTHGPNSPASDTAVQSPSESHGHALCFQLALACLRRREESHDIHSGSQAYDGESASQGPRLDRIAARSVAVLGTTRVGLRWQSFAIFGDRTLHVGITVLSGSCARVGVWPGSHCFLVMGDGVWSSWFASCEAYIRLRGVGWPRHQHQFQGVPNDSSTPIVYQPRWDLRVEINSGVFSSLIIVLSGSY